MTATGELRERLIAVREAGESLLEALDDAVRLADRLDDEAIDAADRFVNRSVS